MPVTTSANLGYPIPGATSPDLRINDMVAIKDALVFLDEDVYQYTSNYPGNIKTSGWETVKYWSPRDLLVNDVDLITPVIFEISTTDIDDGATINWFITNISETDANSYQPSSNNDFTISSGSAVKIIDNYASIETAMMPRTSTAEVEYFWFRAWSNDNNALPIIDKLVTIQKK